MPSLLLRAVLTRVITWLSHLSFWQIMFGLALMVAGALSMRLLTEQRHSAKLSRQLSKAVAELNRISSAKNNQKTVTRENIKVVERVVHDADERAKVVEQAPPAKECRTKPEVLQADL